MALFEVIDNETGLTITVEGDSPPTQEDSLQIIQDARNQVQQRGQTQAQTGNQPTDQTRLGDPNFLQTIAGETEIAKSFASSAALSPFAGLAGIAQTINPFADPGAGARAVEAVQSVAPPIGERGQQVAGSIGEILGPGIPEPIVEAGRAVKTFFDDIKEATFQKFGPLAATAVAILPDALAEFIPGFSAIKKAKNIPTGIADDVVDQVDNNIRAKGADLSGNEPPAEIKSREAIIADIQKDSTKSIERLAGKVEADTEILQAASDLGIVVNPGAYSTNAAFQRVEAAVKSQPDSKLQSVDRQAIDDLGQRADQLIDDLDGSTDKSLLDADVKEQMTGTIDGLARESDLAYAKVNKAIPQSTIVIPKAAQTYITKRLNDIGGDKSLLMASERRLLRWVENPDKPPTYAALDQTRKEVGRALDSNLGEFRNDDQFFLNEVYKVLAADQQRIANGFKIGGQYQLGRKLVAERKTLESQSMTLFNRNVVGSIIPKLTTAAGKLTKGDTSNFIRLMNALPPGRRQQAAATMLGDLFSAGSRRGTALGGGFVKTFEALNRNAGAKREIFKHLPEGAEKRFNDIGKVSTGIFKSKALENRSRTARDILLAIDDGTLYSRLRERTTKIAGTESLAIAGGLAPGLISGLRGITGDLFAQKKTPRIEKADKLFTSPQFRKAIEEAALGKGSRGENIKKTGAFKQWFTAQPPNIKREIAAIGFIPFLTGSLEANLSLEIREEQ